MNNVIEFGSKKKMTLQKKQQRFEELKTRRFSGTITENEEIELENIHEWLLIHNI